MKRSTPLLLAGLVGLTACIDNPAAPGFPASPPLTAAGNPTFSSADLGTPTDRHIAVLTSSSSIPQDFDARVAALGGTIEASYAAIGVAVVSGLSDEAAADLQAADDVAAVDRDFEYQFIDPITDAQVEAAGEVAPFSPADPTTAFFYPRQWHLRAVHADAAWAAGRLGSPSVTVAILDTGIDYRHADLNGRVDLSRSVSFVPSDDAFLAANFPGAHPIADLHFHGTHVSATISSNALAAAGVTSQLTLIGVKVLSRTGSGATSGVLAGIMYAADAGADVINMSLGTRFPILKANIPGLASIFNRVLNYAHRQGVVVVVAAGNENINMDTFGDDWYLPYCTTTQVVCVSALGPTSAGSVNGPWANVDNKASYSNFGVEYISVAGPGGTGGTRSVWAACSGFSIQIPVCRTGTFIVGVSGTSMATPHASGIAALIVEQVGANQPGKVRARLQQSSDDLGVEGADPIYGKGRINAARAIGL